MFRLVSVVSVSAGVVAEAIRKLDTSDSPIVDPLVLLDRMDRREFSVARRELT